MGCLHPNLPIGRMQELQVVILISFSQSRHSVILMRVPVTLALGSRDIHIGIAGCGDLVQQVHLPNLLKIPAVRITAFADPDAASLAQCAKLAPSAQLFPHLEAMLEHEPLDAVLVASPPSQHAHHASLVLQAGLALYLEKPMAATYREAKALMALAEVSAQPAMMGFNYRFSPLRDPSLENKFGSLPATLESVFSIAARPMSPWRQTRASGGGALLEFGSHHIDWILQFAQEQPSSVRANITSERSEHDTATVHLNFPSGIQATGAYSFCTVEQDTLLVRQGGKTTIFNRYTPLLLPLFPLSAFLAYQIERWKSPWKEVSFGRSTRAWVQSLQAGSPPPVSLLCGLDAMQVIDAAERSAIAGEEVDL